MLVIHGFWASDRTVRLWGEDATRPVTSRSQAYKSARPHPFAASAHALADLWAAIRAATDDHSTDPSEPTDADPTAHGTSSPRTSPSGAIPHPAPALGEATLRLPSLAKSPLDSPEVVRVTPRPPAQTDPLLLAWRVPTLALSPARAFAWLTALGEQRGIPAGVDVRFGASVAHLAAIAALAVDLAERRKVLPTVAVADGMPSARWRPVLQGRDVVAVGDLVSALPPVGRAVPGHEVGADIVSAALAAFTDAAVRLRLGDLSMVPPRRGRRPQRLPAVEAWLAALTGATAQFEADPREVETLRRALHEWDEFGTGVVGPARATFRLSEIEPDPDGRLASVDAAVPASSVATGEPAYAAPPDEVHVPDRWRVEFLLQSTLDPSLLVPAAQAWADDGSLDRWLHRPQELLLRELGRASRVYPELAPALRTATPEGLDLDTEGAFRFLSVAVPALDEAGFAVLLPSWWDQRKRLGLKASAATPADQPVTGGAFGRDQLVAFRWDLAVGDDTLSEAEITALVEAKAPLVRLRGQWVAVSADHLRRGLEFLTHQPPGTRTTAEVLALAARHPDDIEAPLPITGVVADGWLGDLLAGTAGAAESRFAPVEPPASFAATLRPYQGRGLSWLSYLSRLGLGACLADDMGLGKTVQLLALESAERSGPTAADSTVNTGPAAGSTSPGGTDAVATSVGPTLLFCPMSLVGNWEREAARFAPDLRVHAHHGRDRLHGDALRDQLAATDLVVTTYATGTRDIDELAAYDWHRVVLDEAQAIKNSLSRAAKATRRLRAAHRIALTGTPVENRLSELWSIMDFLNPGLLGSGQSFRTRYAVPVERHGSTEAAERLRRVTRPYILRRLKTDPTIIDDLPEKIEITEYCRLTVEQASLYQSVVDDMMERIEGSDGIERRGNVLAAMAKLKQVCNHPAQLLHDKSPVGTRSGKVIRLEELLEEIIAEGDRVLCFTQFTEFAEMLLPHLAARFDTDIAYLHGGVPKKRRDEMVARFQAGDGPPIFMLSLKAGGTGLNLTAANHVIHLDRWWNPAVENQATDRAFRIGQKRSVQVRKFVCTGTLEERIDTMIQDKLALANLVVGDGEGWLTELSTRELRDLFALSATAIGEEGVGE
ncbi:MAG TPA: DEAD/DEAH box helicase [Phycicoccus sp.]|nr:DEAD/DEAH box helicase [Phycicoccus sp.]